ncbi:MAG: hypothetical protein ACI9X4_001093 [Glaciecola sp.]
MEVHDFCLMIIPLHLLVRSPCGERSKAKRRIQSDFSRYFNRTRRLPGPLVRARFFSKPVHSDGYRVASPSNQ